MGCDIHAVLEYENEYGHVHTLCSGELNIPRDYKLFGALALGDGGRTEHLPYPPRGIPPNHSHAVLDLFFTDAIAVREYLAEVEGEGETTLENYAGRYGEWALEEYKATGYLPGPELYAASWLNVREIEVAIARADLAEEELSPEFRAVLAAMRVLAGQYSAEKVRLVFWFDGAG